MARSSELDARAAEQFAADDRPAVLAARELRARIVAAELHLTEMRERRFDLIVDMYLAGYAGTELAGLFGVSHERIFQWITVARGQGRIPPGRTGPPRGLREDGTVPPRKRKPRRRPSQQAPS